MTFKKTQSPLAPKSRRTFKHAVTQIGLAALLVLTAVQSQATLWTCSNMFETEPSTAYGAFRTDFDHNTHYTHELKKQSDVRDQCALGTCHLHSWVSMLEQDHIGDRRKEIELSTHYLVSQLWMIRSMQQLSLLRTRTKKEMPISLQLGASIPVSRTMIQAFGLIPDEAWTARRDFQLPGISGRIEEAVKNILARTRRTYEQDPEHLDQIVELGRAAIYDVFKNLVGEPPKEFVFRGQTYTPQTFAKKFYPELESPIVQMYINPTEQTPTQVETEDAVTTVATKTKIVEETAKKLIDEGHNVYLGYEHNSSYVDNRSGVMSLQLYVAPKFGTTVSRNLRDHYNLNAGGHAVQIVGYDLDPKTGEIVKWKIKNSWGEDAGDHGYYHMYADYFRAYAMGISFFREAGMTLPKSEVPPTPQQIELPF